MLDPYSVCDKIQPKGISVNDTPAALYSINHALALYTLYREKETKMFFCNISYKTLAILMKFGT